jgi:hypothetical protein
VPNQQRCHLPSVAPSEGRNITTKLITTWRDLSLGKHAFVSKSQNLKISPFSPHKTCAALRLSKNSTCQHTFQGCYQGTKSTSSLSMPAEVVALMYATAAAIFMQCGTDGRTTMHSMQPRSAMQQTNHGNIPCLITSVSKAAQLAN